MLAVILNPTLTCAGMHKFCHYTGRNGRNHVAHVREASSYRGKPVGRVCEPRQHSGGYPSAICLPCWVSLRSPVAVGFLVVFGGLLESPDGCWLLVWWSWRCRGGAGRRSGPVIFAVASYHCLITMRPGTGSIETQILLVGAAWTSWRLYFERQKHTGTLGPLLGMNPVRTVWPTAMTHPLSTLT